MHTPCVARRLSPVVGLLILGLASLTAFTFPAQASPPPTITSFSPARGLVSSVVVINGTGFFPPVSVTFAGGATGTGSFGFTQLQVTVPAGAQTGKIKVTTGNFSVSTATDFTVGAVPVVNPVVMLAATTPKVTVGSGGAGVFTLTLSAPATDDIVVKYTLKGSALNGTDYILLGGSKKIKAGLTTKTIKVIPQGDLDGAPSKLVKLTLSQGTGYTVGTTTFEKVKIVSGN